MITNASTQQLLVSLPYKILNNASKRNALINGLPAKKILNANQLLMTVIRSAETKFPVGLSVSPPREAKLLLTLPNAPKLTTANINL